MQNYTSIIISALLALIMAILSSMAKTIFDRLQEDIKKLQDTDKEYARKVESCQSNHMLYDNQRDRVLQEHSNQFTRLETELLHVVDGLKNVSKSMDDIRREIKDNMEKTLDMLLQIHDRLGQ